MKSSALRQFRRKLKDGVAVYGMWITLESASITEMAVALGLDWVVIDAEHGHLDWKEINEHVRAGMRSDTVVLVRLAERSTILAKRALDIGADGIVVPWIETVEQVEESLRDCRYPPEGRRGIGAERATVWGQCFTEHTSVANEEVLVIPFIESVAAIHHVAAMCEIDGVEVFFFGPADFSASAGYRGQWEGPGVAEQILQLKETINAAGKYCGVISTSCENLIQRREQGFRMLGLGADSGLLLRSMHQALGVVDRDRAPAASLNPSDGRAVRRPLPSPPERMRSSRREVITPVSSGQTTELESGVVFTALAGDFNQAQRLTTGIVSFKAEAHLDCHVHPCAESITVLEGEVEVQVEGRVYRLGMLDNVVIPRWLPHAVRNHHAANTANLHVALSSGLSERDQVSRSFVRTEMAADSRGTPGYERVTRFQSSERDPTIGKEAEFIDYFNSSLIPGMEISGGFGRFGPGGRLPAHIHDFDESICIIQGKANCMVEGRSYSLGDCATALVPRGLVHYFANDTAEPMAMIWVYAGPMPERILIEESYMNKERCTA